jgi:hypothetical protein
MQSDDGLGAVVGDLAPLARNLVKRLAPRSALDLHNLSRTAEHGLVSEKHAEPAWADKFCVSQQHPIVGNPIGVCGAPEIKIDPDKAPSV